MPLRSSYVQYLPAIFQQDVETDSRSFVNHFLLACERILSGVGDPQERGFEEIIATLYTYFCPGPGQAPETRTPDAFLPWLASWVALSLRADWTSEERRRLISQIVLAYRQRGTRAGLLLVLQAYMGTVGVDIQEFHQAFQIDVTATVGVDTVIGGAPPHYFLATIILPGLGDLDFERKAQIVRAIIDQAKPAHTYYDLLISVPQTMQIGVHSTIDKDTLLGTLSPE